MFKPQSTVKADHTFFLHNVISKELRIYFRFLNIIQYLQLTPKYRIKGDFIFPNGWIAILISFVAMVVSIVGKVLQTAIVLDSNKTHPLFSVLTVSFVISNIIYTVGYITNFVANFVNRYRNVALVLKFQKICNVVGFVDRVDRIQVTCNNVFFVLVICVFGVARMVISMSTTDDRAMELLGDVLQLPFAINMLYATRAVVLLKCCATSFLKQMHCRAKGVNSTRIHCERIFEAFTNLLDCYNLLVESYQDLILYFTMETFGHAMSYIQMAMTLYRFHFSDQRLSKESVLASLIILLWICRNFVLILVLGYEMDKFHIKLDKIQSRTCFYLAKKKNCLRIERETLKNIRRLHRARFRAARARGLFPIDTTLSLQLLTVITTYVIVMLQFNKSNQWNSQS